MRTIDAMGWGIVADVLGVGVGVGEEETIVGEKDVVEKNDLATSKRVSIGWSGVEMETKVLSEVIKYKKSG